MLYVATEILKMLGLFAITILTLFALFASTLTLATTLNKSFTPTRASQQNKTLPVEG